MTETLTLTIAGKPVQATFEYDPVKEAQQKIDSTNAREGMDRPQGG